MMKQTLSQLPGVQLLSSAEKKVLTGGIVRWFTCLSNCHIYNSFDACFNDCPDALCEKGLWSCG
jgi:hypothetical protein